ncbi:hypothetical protein PNOK_0311700 [Pyrrhoderma noxium]|uniref:Uncharacterized protein n=1 Tax=Pyrrhoderma noxium TaxID=2282107 RepID=A0A286ULN4_9AGAM|nr:hypothetical protein PNOK_0311700 [Pyrrhoderma noxium]
MVHAQNYSRQAPPPYPGVSPFRATCVDRTGSLTDHTRLNTSSTPNYGSTLGTPVQRPDYKNEKQASDSLIIILLLVLGLVLGLVLLVIIITLPTPSNYKDKDGISNNGTHRPILVVIHWDKPYPVGRCYAIDTKRYRSKLLNIHIQGQTFNSPKNCTVEDRDIYGYWEVDNQAECNPYWDAPQPSVRCHSYDTREYEALLRNYNFDAYRLDEICWKLPVTVEGQLFEYPYRCENQLQGHRFVGTWLIKNQLECRPYWGPLRHRGCQASGKMRYDAELWQLNEEDDMFKMCATTPNDIFGKHFDMPSACDYRMGRGGMTGIWDVDDPKCHNYLI